MSDKEKLVELLDDIQARGEDFTDYEIYGMRVPDTVSNEDVASYLIAHGVTVQEWGHWVSYQSDEPYGSNNEKEWYKCSKCGKDANGRCYDDEWYSAPILSKRCPHCGTKMMPQPPKGE